MKKKFSAILTFVLAMIVIIPGISAKEIKSIDVKETKSGVITVSGEAENGTLAAAIVVYNSEDSSFVTMQTTSVNDENKYSYDIELGKGKYIVRVADYDGGDFKESCITVYGDVKNPNTLDNIYIYVILLVVAIAGIVYGIFTKVNSKSK